MQRGEPYGVFENVGYWVSKNGLADGHENDLW